MTGIKQKKTTNLALLDVVIDKMHDKEGFCISSLRRKFSPYLSTSGSKNFFTLYAKKGGGFSAVVDEKKYGKNYIHIYHTSLHGYDPVFNFYVKSNKDFMKKILKHNLLS